MTVKGTITKFNEQTWWGEVYLEDGRVLEFHGTTVNGWRNQIQLPGLECLALFNKSGSLFDIRILDAV